MDMSVERNLALTFFVFSACVSFQLASLCFSYALSYTRHIKHSLQSLRLLFPRNLLTSPSRFALKKRRYDARYPSDMNPK